MGGKLAMLLTLASNVALFTFAECKYLEQDFSISSSFSLDKHPYTLLLTVTLDNAWIQDDVPITGACVSIRLKNCHSF